MMFKRILIIILFISPFLRSEAQVEEPTREYMYLITDEGDTIPFYMFPAANIVGFKLNTKKEIRKYNRLKAKVIKVYPYAEIAGAIMEDFGREYETLDTKKSKRKYANQAEDNLKEQFEGDLRNMKVSEGVILIKLIDRQTGNSSYELVKDLKSGMSAFMWQTVALLFGHDLKDKYDPNNDREDQMIEDIVDRIESGEFTVNRKQLSLDK